VEAVGHSRDIGQFDCMGDAVEASCGLSGK